VARIYEPSDPVTEIWTYISRVTASGFAFAQLDVEGKQMELSLLSGGAQWFEFPEREIKWGKLSLLVRCVVSGLNVISSVERVVLNSRDCPLYLKRLV
jgi:hypothetical protein